MQGHLLRQALQAKNLGSPFIVSIIKEQWPVELGLFNGGCIPNAVWHIDTHHKLIRWRMIIHAGVAWFSCTIIMYIKCCVSNRAATFLEVFCEGLEKFRLPNTVRTDHGRENIDIWHYMIASHNSDTSWVITDSSTHNERVERLWREYTVCIYMYMQYLNVLQL